MKMYWCTESCYCLSILTITNYFWIYYLQVACYEYHQKVVFAQLTTRKYFRMKKNSIFDNNATESTKQPQIESIERITFIRFDFCFSIQKIDSVQITVRNKITNPFYFQIKKRK